MDLDGKYLPTDIKDIFLTLGFKCNVTKITEIGGTLIKDLNIILFAKNSHSLNLEIFTYKNQILFNLDAGFFDVSINRKISNLGHFQIISENGISEYLKLWKSDMKFIDFDEEIHFKRINSFNEVLELIDFKNLKDSEKKEIENKLLDFEKRCLRFPIEFSKKYIQQLSQHPMPA